VERAFSLATISLQSRGAPLVYRHVLSQELLNSLLVGGDLSVAFDEVKCGANGAKRNGQSSWVLVTCFKGREALLRP
jgi:hypothetical protein